jgi:hypothetical protein
MVLASVNHHTVEIDPYHLNTGDDDHYKHHYFSNKAPGQSFVGVPVYLAFKEFVDFARGRELINDWEQNSGWKTALLDAGCIIPIKHDHCRFLTPQILGEPRLDFAVIQYIEAISTAAIPAVLLVLLLYWFLGIIGGSSGERILLALGLGLGTDVFAYAQNFYSHVPAALLEFAGFVFAYIATSPPEGVPRVPRFLLHNRSLLLVTAGLCAGLSIDFEYPTLLITLLIACYVVLRVLAQNNQLALSRGAIETAVRPLALFVLGMLPGLLVVMAYNFGVYHDPFTTGYGCNDTSFHRLGRKSNPECQGIGGFTLPPKPLAIGGMTGFEYRGLFFESPFLVLSILGYAYATRYIDKVTNWLLLGVPVVFFLAICCYAGWQGGQVVGPRYLIPLLPFLVAPSLFALKTLRTTTFRICVVVLFAASFAINWIETIGGRQFATGNVSSPLTTWSWPQFVDGNLPLNLGTFLGLDGKKSLILLAAIVAVWSGVMLLRPRPHPATTLAASATAKPVP